MSKSREQGKALERWVATMLEDIDPRSRPTRGSGCGNEIADISNRKFIVECKQRTTADITIKSKVWKKLCSEIPVGSIRIPLYVLENKDKQRWVVMEANDFFRMARKLHEEES